MLQLIQFLCDYLYLSGWKQKSSLLLPTFTYREVEIKDRGMLFGETSYSKGPTITNLCKKTYSMSYVIYISKALIYFTLHLNSPFKRIFQSCVWDFCLYTYRNRYT